MFTRLRMHQSQCYGRGCVSQSCYTCPVPVFPIGPKNSHLHGCSVKSIQVLPPGRPPPPSTRHSDSPATFWQPKTTEWDDYVEQWKDLPVAAQYKATIAVYADACQVRTAC